MSQRKREKDNSVRLVGFANRSKSETDVSNDPAKKTRQNKLSAKQKKLKCL